MIGFSHAAATDMPFAAMLTIALVFAAIVLGAARDQNSPILPRTPWLALFFLGFFLGLAALAKGPAALVLASGAVLLWALITKRWRGAFRCLHPVSIASFCLTALPWYILCGRRNPNFFRIFIIEHNFKRYLTPEFQHIQPFWFYVPVLLVCFIPWIFLFIWTLCIVTKNLRFSLPHASLTLLFISWSIFCLVFFSISKSKLPGYILPAIPPLGLILAHQFTLGPKNPRRFAILLATFALFSVAAAEWLRRSIDLGDVSDMQKTMLVVAVAAALLLIAFSNWLLAAGYLAWTNRTIRDLFFTSAILIILAALIFWPNYMNNYQRGSISAKTVAEGLHDRQIPVDRIFVWKNASRNWRFGASFYLHSEITDWDPGKDQQSFVITGTVPCSQLQASGYIGKSIVLSALRGTWFVCQMTPASLVGDLGQLRGSGGRSNDRAGGQPR